MTLPILNASGCLDALTAPSVAQALDAFVTKTVTPLPREGNAPPRVAETDHGMVNSIGLQNPGIDAFLEHVLPRLGTLGVPIWVSVGGFTADDFALYHPAGALGRRLLRVEDLMNAGAAMPVVPEDAPLDATLLEITSKRLGVTGVVDAAGDLTGIITDGDLRRGLASAPDIRRLRAADLMTRAPKTIAGDAIAGRAVAVMERHRITSLFVLAAGSRRPAGVIHLHDLLRAGIV